MKKILFFSMLLAVLVCSALIQPGFGYERRALGEMFTSTTCGPCFNANNQLDKWTDPSDPQYIEDWVVIRYHMGWPAPGNDPFYLANTLHNNIIKKTTDWPQIQGNPEKEDAIQFGPSVPDALRDFNPAKVTSIEGTTVSGTSGTNSLCPNCLIELYLDDTDNVVEALQLLGVTTAGSNGNWTATISAELQSGQGIRTTSTTAQYNTIPNMSAGTTTKLSELYTSEIAVFLPFVIR